MSLIPYKYAELCDTSDRWYIYFWVVNPDTRVLQRKKIYISHKSKANRRRLAMKMMALVNAKLDQGWNPFISDSHKKMFTPLVDALNDLLDYKSRYMKKRSLPNYRSRIEKLKEWIEKTGNIEIRTSEFTETMAQDYMTYLLKRKTKFAATTFNNYLTDYRTFWNYMVKKKHCLENVFKSVDMLPETEKRKRPFTIEEQTEYRLYLEKNDQPFLVTSMLCYYCGLRPEEITSLKVKDINIHRKMITVDPGDAKNRKQRIIPVAEKFWNLLLNHVKDKPSNFYIISKNFIPGLIRIAPTRIAEHFRKIADSLGFDQDVKFYSLKDTSADNLDQSGISTKTIRDLFGHSSIAVTDAYMRTINSKNLDQLRNAFPDFGN